MTRSGPSAALAARLLLVASVAVAAASCASPVGPGSGGSGASGSDGRVIVVTTTTVFADLVRQVGGGLVDAFSLVPNGGDVHTFAPRPSDMRGLSSARLIVMNGLGLDDWVGRLISDAGATVPVIRLAENLPGARYLVDPSGTTNPHLWLEVPNAERYVGRIADALAGVDPPHAAAYRAGAAAYAARLQQLDGWIRTQIGTIPPQNRRLVAFHDAFPYFADAYGLEIVGTVVAAAGQEPGAGQVTRLIDAIRAAHVRAVFAEAQFNPAIAQAVAADSGALVVTDLYDDTLGPAPADTYEGMMRWDVEKVVGALK